MPLLTVPCPHCRKPAKLDSSKLPDTAVAYPCPHCKQKVVADKRQLLEQHATQQAQQQAPQQPAPSPTAQSPAGAAEAVALPSSAPQDRRFTRLPRDAKLPSGVIFGDDDAVIEEIRSKLAAMGSELERVESADVARQLIIAEGTELCICVSSGEVKSPYTTIQPLIGLPPETRRQTYLALVADNVKTLDGTEAFVHQVNLVIGKPDVAHFEAALYSGIDYHDRLYRGYLQAIEQKNAV